MTIVCGTNFSENATQASRAAAALAQRVKEPLKLVHVLGAGAAELPGLAMLYEPFRALLAAQAERLSKDFGVEVEPVILEGAPEARLVELAGRVKARLLVLSALGSKNQDHWLLGSVAERVAQRSPAPTLVVREPASIEAWARGERPLKIVLGVDLGPSSRIALHWVEGLRAIAPCDVRIVQLVWPLGEHARFGIKRPIELEGLRPELQALLDRDLRAWAGTLNGAGTVSYQVSSCWGRFDAQLTALAQDARVDLLVVGTHQRSWSERIWQASVSRGAIQYGTCNVACVPDPGLEHNVTRIKPYRSVLIPTDFSALANRAVEAGYGLLGPGGEAHLLYVLTCDDPDPPPRDLKDRLRALIPADAVARGLSTQIHVVDDSEAWAGIWHASERLAVDAICMATHGRGNAAQLVLGSQAQEVLRRARPPVLLVRGAEA
jgi:nucleotide-binding universal stress UspA family protein